MALNGRLEDMNLLEILQIVGFSKKTGTLEIQSPQSNGSILFREGRVLCAFSSPTAREVHDLAGRPLDSGRQSVLAANIRTALRELVALREGQFEFRLLPSLPQLWCGMDASFLLAGEGLDTQQLLLELAHELDEARRDSTRLLEESESMTALDAPAAESSLDDRGPLPPLFEQGTTVLLADDEPLVLQIVGQVLDDAGSIVEIAGGAAEALQILSRLQRSKDPLALVVDAGMPTSNGDGFDGGFEILESPVPRELGIPSILIAESLTPESRARARRAGVSNTALKPTLTKLDPEEYGADLRAFARALVRELAGLLKTAREGAAAAPEEPSLSQDLVFDFLKNMTDQLSSTGAGITRTILRVAARYSERAVLFLVKDGRATGLAAIQHGRATPELIDTVRRVSFELHHVEPFAEVVYSRRPVRAEGEKDRALEPLDPGRARELALFPLLHNHEVLAVLACDNPGSGTPLSKLTGLQLFLIQAGMALENASLHRRLRSMERRYSLEDQGPLTEELSPTLRERP